MTFVFTAVKKIQTANKITLLKEILIFFKCLFTPGCGTDVRYVTMQDIVSLTVVTPFVTGTGNNDPEW